MHTEGENRYKLGVAELMEAKDGRRPGDSLGGVASRPGGGEVYPRRSALAPGAGVDGALRVV